MIDKNGQCSECKMWPRGRTLRHKCPPEYDVANEEGELLGVAYAYATEDAAEWWREFHSDHEDGDEEHVAVRLRGGEKWDHFNVEREYEPTYRASEAEAPDTWVDPDDDA